MIKKFDAHIIHLMYLIILIQVLKYVVALSFKLNEHYMNNYKFTRTKLTEFCLTNGFVKLNLRNID